MNSEFNILQEWLHILFLITHREVIRSGLFHVVPQVLPLPTTTVCTHKAYDFRYGKRNASTEPQFLITARKYPANGSLANVCKYSVLEIG
jgi:hypothetical protein